MGLYTTGIGDLYVIRCKNYYKIGISGLLGSRFGDLQASNPFKIYLVYYKEYKQVREVERRLHHKLRKKKHRGEWYKLSKKDLEFIKNFK